MLWFQIWKILKHAPITNIRHFNHLQWNVEKKSWFNETHSCMHSTVFLWLAKHKARRRNFLKTSCCDSKKQCEAQMLLLLFVLSRSLESAHVIFICASYHALSLEWQLFWTGSQVSTDSRSLRTGSRNRSPQSAQHKGKHTDISKQSDRKGGTVVSIGREVTVTGNRKQVSRWNCERGTRSGDI